MVSIVRDWSCRSKVAPAWACALPLVVRRCRSWLTPVDICILCGGLFSQPGFVAFVASVASVAFVGVWLLWLYHGLSIYLSVCLSV